MYRQYQDLQLFDVLFLSYTCHRNAIRSSCHHINPWVGSTNEFNDNRLI